MIDFILSKLGILLFAITMAGILLYFSASIKDVFLSDETVQISNIMAKQIKYMAESDNLCSSTKVILPKYIDIFGVTDSQTFSAIYYNLNISIKKNESTGDNFVIFSIVNKQTKKEIAMESFMTKSDVTLYDQTTNSITDNLFIDPTLNSKQVVYMVKSKSSDNTTFEEKTNIFFVNCKYDKSALATENSNLAFNDCYMQLADLQSKMNNTDYPFFCVPTSAAPIGVN